MDLQTSRQTDRQLDRLRVRQGDKQTDKQTEGQLDRDKQPYQEAKRAYKTPKAFMISSWSAREAETLRAGADTGGWALEGHSVATSTS